MGFGGRSSRVWPRIGRATSTVARWPLGRPARRTRPERRDFRGGNVPLGGAVHTSCGHCAKDVALDRSPCNQHATAMAPGPTSESRLPSATLAGQSATPHRADQLLKGRRRCRRGGWRWRGKCRRRRCAGRRRGRRGRRRSGGNRRDVIGHVVTLIDHA